MRAYVMHKPGDVDELQLTTLPDPTPKKNWILIEIKGFGLNRSELYTRQGHSGDAVTLPRILGIECVGVVLDGGGTDLIKGQKVVAAMGEMGRKHDGGYAEKALLPRSHVYPISTNLPWEILAALPESYLTAWGVLHETIDISHGQKVLIRGGSSSVGLAAINIAKDHGLHVLATTRSESKSAKLKQAGADEIILDQGNISDIVKSKTGSGVDGVVELVGLPATITDSLQCCRDKGVVGMVGFLGNTWEYEFFPWMPSTVRLSLYSSETLEKNYATPVMQQIVQKIESGAYRPNIEQVFSFEELHQAHRIMETNTASGKLVVVT
ncbi:zinc-binding dehydrogenase [Vibrio sp. SM6]|uniref:Zinc-binding dehydrogenase n=1 Tax=Vibrio agarilyticus TaxID=2726741 RepID=A0A7X8YIG7_9VIBR|nr:zinc-binding dehydrogenase [Vibrio agarilyticus]NLS14709.1 zinc-binding dehydrogenase [Vibrio agarilyticus]